MSDAVVGWALPIATLVVLAGASWWRLRPARSGGRGVNARLTAYDGHTRPEPEPRWDERGRAANRFADRPVVSLHEAVTERVLITAVDGSGRTRPRHAPVTVLRASQRPVRHELLPLAGGPAVPLLAGTTVDVGRAPDSGLRIDLPGVSYRHARLCPVGMDGSRILVEDCDSTNGTAVNGRRIVGAVSLASGDVVRFGGAYAPAFEYRRVAAFSAVPVEVTA